ncbi:MAG: hypothetical protein Q9221_003073 [Calogaya cf. arnoldii]
MEPGDASLSRPAWPYEEKVIRFLTFSFAARTGLWYLLGHILNQGTDPNWSFCDGSTALPLAIERQDVRTVKLFLGHGADADGAPYGRQVLFFAAAAGCNEVVDTLLNYGADVDKISWESNLPWRTDLSSQQIRQGSALSGAAGKGHISTVQLLRSRDAKLNVKGKYTLITSTFDSSSYSSLDIRFYYSCGTLLNEGRDSICHALDTAIFGDHPKVVRLLIDAGVHTNTPDCHDVSALHTACWLDRREIAGILVEAGANINAISHGYGTPLEVASRCNAQSVVRFLLEEGAEIEVCGQAKLVNLASSWCVDDPTIDIILQARADRDADESEFRKALDIACEAGKDKLGRRLIDRGVDISQEDNDLSPLKIAARDGSCLEFMILLDAGVEYDVFEDEWENLLQASLHCRDKDTYSIIGRHRRAYSVNSIDSVKSMRQDVPIVKGKLYVDTCSRD